MEADKISSARNNALEFYRFNHYSHVSGKVAAKNKQRVKSGVFSC